MTGLILTWAGIAVLCACILWGKKIIRDTIDTFTDEAEYAGKQEFKIRACGLLEGCMRAKEFEGDTVSAGVLRSCGELIWQERWGLGPEFFKNASRKNGDYADG